MLKLKRVEIHGFKSFYDRTEMKFAGNGIAAVVGPNGCGKSNLSDAISWVLGEQSAKTLRGARMEDVIFAGTRDKKALGMAAVTMTLVPDEAALAASRLPDSDNSTLNHSPNKVDAGEGTIDSPQSAPGSANPTDNVDAFPHQALEHPNTVEIATARKVSSPAPSAASRTAERTGEITITRRLYRSGDSEYLINGKQARLRDIQDLFFGTGLGPESYAIIEQGRIGQILSNKPQDRRNVIEEAAGITKFKTRKRLAEAKLESAKQNLSRVFDILEEVTRQANSLKRQAAKTKRYGELKAEATEFLQQILATKFQALEREMAKTTIELSLAAAELGKAQSAIGEYETEQETVLAASYATEAELTERRKILGDLKLEAERARGKLEYQTKQITRIEEALGTSGRDIESLTRQGEERSAELNLHVAELAEVEHNCGLRIEELRSKQNERQVAQSFLSEGERGLEGKRQNVLRLLGEASGLKNRITQIEAQLGASDRDVNRAREEEAQGDRDLARVSELRTNLSTQLAARQTALISVQEQRKTVESELQRKRAQLNETRSTLDRLKSEVSRVRARRDSLEEVIQHRSYTTETVKRLFTAVERGKTDGFRPIGVLADFLEVDPDVEKATEEFLHDELEFVVVRDWGEGEQGIDLMRGELNGRATFLIENAGQPSEPSWELPYPPVAEGSLTRLTDALRWSNGLSQLPVEQLPRIANCFLATERSLARELATQFPHCWFLTTEGVNYHGQAISGGKKTGAGPLALKRELRDVSKLEEAKTAELRSAQDIVTELEVAIGSLGEELDALRSQQQHQEKDVLALDHESRKLSEESGRAQSRLSHARLELERIARERVKLEETLSRDRETVATIEAVRREEEEALETARGELAGLRSELARLNEEHAGIRADLASVEERRRSLTNSRVRLESQLKDLVNRRAHLEGETGRLSTERAHLLASNTELGIKIEELRLHAADVENSVSGLAAKEAELRAHLAAAEEKLKQLRSEAQQHQEQRSECQVVLARSESQLHHLEETCTQELGTTLVELAKSVEAVPEEDTLLAIEGKHSEVRRKIEALGPVNPQALEEFEEALQRQEFLTAQRQDLLDSIRDTERAIHEIDTESRKRFGEAFHAINANFKEMFKNLFGGGTGEMRLTDEENLAESGIDIVASPPGKRLQSVLLLSGGEKSLTAMALLMSIFQYTPSPFCILDEVDAPLDEPNIERLTQLLKGMAAETQFIVITHSKRTMEAAQSLYGVTMQEPGVSKLVSVRFNSADEGNTGRSRRNNTAPAQLAMATA